jgi:hypothetical protein
MFKTHVAAAPLALALLTLSAGSTMLAGPAVAQASAAHSELPGAYRVDSLREGVFEGAPVRFLDLTLRNTSPHATTSQGVVDVWWQGRGRGESVRARRRDLSDFGMYDFVKPGQTLPVTFVLPLRSDIAGVEIEVAHPGSGPKKQAWTWEQLSAASPR